MQTLIGLAVLVLDIVAILDVLKNVADQGKKVLWIALIIILPVIGLILYYLVGKKNNQRWLIKSAFGTRLEAGRPV